MRLLTVIVNRDRLPFLRETVASYRETVTVDHDLVIVDNASTGLSTHEFLLGVGCPVLRLPMNYYPGYAANRGFRLRGPEHTHLHRSDNDIRFLPGWCREMEAAFETLAGEQIGQVSLRTDEQEPDEAAVGGNMVVRASLWDRGLRYTDLPWDQVPWEDGLLTGEVERLGFKWTRVSSPATVHLGDPPDFTDDYYRATYSIRGLDVPG